MGGEQKVRALSALHFQAAVVRNMLEQSERPEGPNILENDLKQAGTSSPYTLDETTRNPST